MITVIDWDTLNYYCKCPTNGNAWFYNFYPLHLAPFLKDQVTYCDEISHRCISKQQFQGQGSN